MLEQVTAVHSQGRTGTPVSRGSAEAAGMEQLPDLLLIERARAGEERAIEALSRRYCRRLFRVALSVLGDDERAAASVQEAYRLAFADLNRHEPNGKFAAWLTRLSYNQARQLRASAAARATHPNGSEELRNAAAPTDGAAAELHERLQLERSISALPEVFRTVFVLRVIEGISGIETAASLGVHETTVRTRLYRAQRRLTPEIVRQARSAQGLFDLAAARAERIVNAVLSERPQRSILTIVASTP